MRSAPETPRPLMSVEEELSTLYQGGHAEDIENSVFRPLFDELWATAPCVSGPTGLFLPYGRVYGDCGHIESAICECDSPLTLALVRDRQHAILRRAVERVRDRGPAITLGNSNYSGVLGAEGGTWGSHENYFIRRPPASLVPAIVPFLATRLYAGSGGVTATGQFAASARMIYITRLSGGNTTHERALNGDSRNEPLTGLAGCYRYHGIAADGHRSQWNLALQTGATWLVLQVLTHGPRAEARLASIVGPPTLRNWITRAKRYNVLQVGSRGPRVALQVIATQRTYHAEAAAFVARWPGDPPEWLPWVLEAWGATLDAWARGDVDWLAQRCDAFTKFKLWAGMLAAERADWSALATDSTLRASLTLAGQKYHEFTEPNNPFDQLDRAGVLRHRVGPEILPGEEPEPYVPEVATRAQARARLIVARKGDRQLRVDWASAEDERHQKQLLLQHPFATEFVERARATAAPSSAQVRNVLMADSMLYDVFQEYLLGRYETASVLLDRYWALAERNPAHCGPNYFRYRAWVQARRGCLDGLDYLHQWETQQGRSLKLLADSGVALRFQGLVPPAAMQSWVEEVSEVLIFSTEIAASDTDCDSIRTSRAAFWVYHGPLDQAATELGVLRRRAGRSFQDPRLTARVLCTLGEACRRQGRLISAARAFRQAERLYHAGRNAGERAELALTGLARTACRSSNALRYLAEVRATQEQLLHHVGLVRTMLLEVRRGIDADTAASHRRRILHHRERVPALAACDVLGRILDHWDAWRGGEAPRGEPAADWGL